MDKQPSQAERTIAKNDRPSVLAKLNEARVHCAAQRIKKQEVEVQL
jgi:hypothetical protein